MNFIQKYLKKILATAGALVLVIAIIVGDSLCYAHAGEITNHLCPDKIVYDKTNAVEALGKSDEVIQRTAEEGITLLKNNGALPLDTSDLEEDEKYRVNLFGVGSTDSDVNGFYVFGGGSGSVTHEKKDCVFLKESLEATGFAVNTNLYNYFKDKQANPSVEWWTGNSSLDYRNYAKAFSDTAIITISRFTGENCDDPKNLSDNVSFSFGTPWKVSYVDKDADDRNFCQLSLKEEAMIKWCGENFENVIVIINSGNVMELGALDDANVDAVMYVPYPGQSGAYAIGRILTGEVNPSGHTTDTFAYSTKDAPYYADAVFQSYKSSIQIAYTEDIYIGYKWYETADKEGYFTAKGTSYDKVVQYPFGHGLSYTNFEWSLKGVTVQKKGDETVTSLSNGGTIEDKTSVVTLTVEVKNTGKVAGKEVVQLYTTAPYTKGGIEKAHVALTDFAKTETLYPAAQATADKPNSQTLTLSFELYEIASYDCYDKNGNGFAGYELDGGEYTLSLRNNAHEVNECANAEFKFKIGANGFKFDKDNATGNTVENRFTGETAEANVPIDGSKSGETPITYLSRADFAATFPTKAFAVRTSGYDIVKNDGIGAYMDDAVYYPGVTMPTFDADRKLFLYTRKDGSAPNYNDLARKGEAIVVNDALVRELGSNYDSEKWDQLLAQLTVDDAKIVSYHGNGTDPAVSVGKPRDTVCDGPQGINYYSGSCDSPEDVSAFPAEAMMGMTYNKELLREIGAAMGSEVSASTAIGIYAPAVDTHRHPYNGRNFEQFGEDGTLCGKLGAREVYGMITHGCQPSVKHFVISTPGKNPMNYNSWITEQNLRENYLRAFEWTVKDGNTNFLMTSFNNIGGVKCAFSYALNTQILRDEWGFKGAVVTDYNVYTNDGRSTAGLVRAGNDLRFQGNSINRSELDENNAVDMALAVRAVKNTLYAFCNTYYRTVTYNPNYSFTQATVIPRFNWWVPSLVGVNVFIIGGFLFLVFWLWIKDLIFKPAAAAAVASAPLTGKTFEPAEEAYEEEPEAEAPPVGQTATSFAEKVEEKAEPIKKEVEGVISYSIGAAQRYLNGVKYYALCATKGLELEETETGCVFKKNGEKAFELLIVKDTAIARFEIDKKVIDLEIKDSASFTTTLLFIERA